MKTYEVTEEDLSEENMNKVKEAHPQAFAALDKLQYEYIDKLVSQE